MEQRILTGFAIIEIREDRTVAVLTASCRRAVDCIPDLCQRRCWSYAIAATAKAVDRSFKAILRNNEEGAIVVCSAGIRGATEKDATKTDDEAGLWKCAVFVDAAAPMEVVEVAYRSGRADLENLSEAMCAATQNRAVEIAVEVGQAGRPFRGKLEMTLSELGRPGIEKTVPAPYCPPPPVVL